MANNLSQEISELKNKLHIFSAVMRLTKDAFACKDLTALGIHIVNNSRILLQFDRSVLLVYNKVSLGCIRPWHYQDG